MAFLATKNPCLAICQYQPCLMYIHVLNNSRVYIKPSHFTQGSRTKINSNWKNLKEIFINATSAERISDIEKQVNPNSALEKGIFF